MKTVYPPMDSRQHQFEALVRGHSTDLYRYAYWLCGQDALAQDLVQDTFLRAWRALDKLREVSAVKAWLITILRREHARLFERKAMPSDDIDDLDLPDPQAAPERRTEESALRQAIATLEPKYREPLLLQVLGGFTCAEIAGQLGLGEAAVMTQLFRARQKLKGQLGNEEQAAEISEL
ncbi:MAG TPA: sigma-70 family RNA polymerase sigma factor [Dokdonella sp.]|uniref:sigma-70 family RNA polymerase sigma factor n=1 Tax=Dokdonella sp. TaxID=2291710 RepID=UPI002BE0DBB5|nr:sigma-70 family RNA polymerase sigma factor [Dokdonella sp.]HOX72920.1 sigma-70 family RNA polymerase sigma factor [Dokdonella sp.]HPG94946.1 sigma-70 family RNA polymerase sigma factor [Dokdonella sp.]HPN79904.1 sigma-70 family RNA polymerase sigma factor [Dokdonella sp.]